MAWVLDLDDLTIRRQRGDLAQYAALFAERTADGEPLTLQEIGRRMGVTRENVRQIRLQHFPELAPIRAITKPLTLERAKRKRLTPYMFRRIVRGWLRAEGYFQCGLCLLTRYLAEASKPQLRRCKRCVADHAAAYYEAAEAKAKRRDWQAAHPEEVREYSRRYQLKRRQAT